MSADRTSEIATEEGEKLRPITFARRDVVTLDAILLGPLEHCVRGQLGAVVGDDHLQLATLGDDRIQLPDQALAQVYQLPLPKLILRSAGAPHARRLDEAFGGVVDVRPALPRCVWI
jgi:hypothetical protein